MEKAETEEAEKEEMMKLKFMSGIEGTEERDCPVVVIGDKMYVRVGSLTTYLGPLFGSLMAMGNYKTGLIDYIEICKLADLQIEGRV